MVYALWIIFVKAFILSPIKKENTISAVKYRGGKILCDRRVDTPADIRNVGNIAHIRNTREKINAENKERIIGRYRLRHKLYPL